MYLLIIQFFIYACREKREIAAEKRANLREDARDERDEREELRRAEEREERREEREERN